jgi:hypothetical protein
MGLANQYIGELADRQLHHLGAQWLIDVDDFRARWLRPSRWCRWQCRRYEPLMNAGKPLPGGPAVCLVHIVARQR